MDLNIYYVGQANFLILIRNENALVYDCGATQTSNFLRFSKFNHKYKKYFINIFKEVENILIVISHSDKDHSNLCRPLIKLLDKINKSIENNINIKEYGTIKKNYDLIESGTEEELKTELRKKRNFLNSKLENDNDIEIKAFVPPRNKDKRNENSIILKIIGRFENEETYSILLTGDATKNTLKKIISNYYNGNKKIAIKEIFSDVLCHLNPHHGAITEKSYIWSENVIKFSKYPAINVISSNPIYYEGKPSFHLIKRMAKYYDKHLKSKESEKYYKHFYCIPHYISCSLNSEIFEYHSFSSGIEMPVFITYDSFSGGYRINFNSNGVTMNDDINIEKNASVNINKPLYEYKLDNTFTAEKEMLQMYSFYLAYRNLKISNINYEKISNDDFRKESFNKKNIKPKKMSMERFLKKIEKCIHMQEICEVNCRKLEYSFNNLKESNKLELFTELALILKQIININKDTKVNNQKVKREISDLSEESNENELNKNVKRKISDLSEESNENELNKNVKRKISDLSEESNEKYVNQTLKRKISDVSDKKYRIDVHNLEGNVLNYNDKCKEDLKIYLLMYFENDEEMKLKINEI